MSSRKFSSLLVTTAIGCFMSPMSVHAQAVSAAAAAPQASGGGTELEEIVVQTQRRQQNLQVVPVSVMRIGAEQIQNRAAITLEALDHVVPDVVIEHVGLFRNAASLSMRGVGYSGIESYTDPEVAVYVNGIYQARNANALDNTLDVSSIEIMRGPQGTLYGRNAFAGAIAVRTNKPDMTAFNGSATFTAGNFGLFDGDLIANMPIVDNVIAGRLAFRAHSMDGYYTNNGVVGRNGLVDPSLRGQEIGFEKTYTIKPSLRFTPSDNWDITLFGEVYLDRSQANPQGHIVLPGSVLAAAGFPGFNPFGDPSRGIPSDGSDPYSVGFSLPDKSNYENQYNLTIDAAYQSEIGTFRFLGNYQYMFSNIWSDSDGENINIFSSNRVEDYEAYSGELQYVSNFSDAWDIVAGALALHDSYQTTQLTFTAAPPGPAVFSTFTVNPAYINNSGDRTSLAAYAQVEYHVTDQLGLVLGGRYSYEEKYNELGENTTLSAAGFPKTLDISQHAYSTVPGVLFGPIGHSWGNFAPRVGINYKVDPDVLLYAFWQRAFKSGGFNGNAADRFGFNSPYGVERADTYEAGIKSEWFDRRLRVNLNGFYTNYTGLQRSLVTPSPTAPSGVVTVVTNAANLTSYGLELETAAKPVEQLTLFANAGFDRAYYTSYCAPLAGLQATTAPAVGSAACGAVTSVSTAAGKRYLVPADYSFLNPVRAPKWDISFGFTKDFTIANQGVISATATANYRSGQYVQLMNVPYSYRPGMVTLDASFRWDPDDERYSVTLWARNLTDDIQILNYLPIGALLADQAATPPRTFGVTASVKF